MALTSEGRPLSTEAVLGSAAKPQPVNEILNIETQTLATNSAESAGKDYVSCLKVIPESNFTKSNNNDGFVNQAYIQLIPNKMDSNPEILESLLEISSYKRMIRVMAWVLRAATILKGYSLPSEALDAKELARGEAVIQTFLQCNSVCT